MSISKNKSLVFIIVFLLLTNIAVLVYFLRPGASRNEKHSQGKNGLATALQKEVGFSDDQLARYKSMREEQFKVMGPMMEEIRRTKDSMFRQMGNTSLNDSMVNVLATSIAERQKEIDVRAFAHFRRVRSLCTPEQLPKYDTVVLKMIRKMGKSGKAENAKPKS